MYSENLKKAVYSLKILEYLVSLSEAFIIKYLSVCLFCEIAVAKIFN